jgi:poly(beta-D-mannuronate) lyase
MAGIKNTKGPFREIKHFFDAVRNAEAGDRIILANGTYNVQDQNTKFTRIKGTKNNPIVVMAENVGEVTLKGQTGYRFEECEFFTWHGFNHMQNASDDDNITFRRGRNNTFSRCEVKLKDQAKKPDDDDNNNWKTHWLQISDCKAMKVDHCFFHHKPSKGNFCNVKYRDDNKPGEGPIFEYNHFLHQDYDKFITAEGGSIGDAGGEAIQMGDSQLCRFYYRGIFRYNYFEECNGDGEMITNKSSGNLYYNNSFMKTVGTMTLRHGDSTAFLGNYFKECGLRVGGRGNLIANNHFAKNSAEKPQRRPLTIGRGDWEQDPRKQFTSNMQGAHYERVVNNTIILNTFANEDGEAPSIVYWGFQQDDEKLLPTGNKFKGNIITAKKGKLLEVPRGVVINGDGVSNEVSDNIGWPTDRAQKGELSSTMATLDQDPLLKMDSDGIHRLQNNSPARNKFQGTPFGELTTVDIDGEERGPNTDAGCDQFSTALNKPKKRITAADVGPKATIHMGDSPDWNPKPVNPRPQEG